MRWLEHKVPPPIVGALVGVAMWAVAHFSPELPIERPLRIALALVVAGVGVAFVALGGIAFRRARTTTNPLKPEAASSLVIAGVYRYTRNPMYVGVACVLVGWAVYRGSLPAFVGPVVFVLFITRFQIIPEERVLSAKFGPKFAEYQAKVRRWL